MRRAMAVLILLTVGACSSSDSNVSTATSTQSPAIDSTTTTAETGTNASSEEVQETRNTEYTTAGGKMLDIYSPGGSARWPVVLVVNGVSQGKGRFAPLAEAISAKGAVVFNVDVTMAEPFDTAISQVACAVRYAHATAADYGGDPSRITLVGNSAGATTGIIVAMTGDDVARDCVADGPAELDAVVGYEGPYDWATTDYGQVDVSAYESSEPDVWAAVDPYAHLGGNPDLVIRLIHGDDTDVAWYEVPRAVSVDFHQALVDAGYDAEITLVDGASHTAITRPGSEAFAITVRQAFEVAQG